MRKFKPKTAFVSYAQAALLITFCFQIIIGNSSFTGYIFSKFSKIPPDAEIKHTCRRIEPGSWTEVFVLGCVSPHHFLAEYVGHHQCQHQFFIEEFIIATRVVPHIHTAIALQLPWRQPQVNIAEYCNARCNIIRRIGTGQPPIPLLCCAVFCLFLITS